MARFRIGRVSRIATMLVAAVLSLAITAAASADTPGGRGQGGRPAPTPVADDCAVMRVQLNGNQPATTTCLASTSVAAALPTTQYCISSDFQIFEDKNFGGKKLCFYGSGFVRLNEYRLYSSLPWPTWDDRISSFKTGKFQVDMYEHNHAGGERVRYVPWQERSVMRSGWNDRVSSICIWGPNITC